MSFNNNANRIFQLKDTISVNRVRSYAMHEAHMRTRGWARMCDYVHTLRVPVCTRGYVPRAKAHSKGAHTPHRRSPDLCFRDLYLGAHAHTLVTQLRV